MSDKLTFLDKLRILLEVSQKSYIGFIALIGLIVLAVMLTFTNSHNRKRNKFIYLSLVISILLLFLIIYFNSLTTIFNYMMDNFFIILYYPNLAIYLISLIITNIIVWISIFHRKTTDIIKKVNIVIFTIIHYLAVLILNTVNISKVDVFLQESIYKSNKLTALLELSSIIFVVWIIFLILYKIILTYISKDIKEETNKIIVKQEIKKLPKYFQPILFPQKVVNNKKNIKPKVLEEKINKQMNNMFTLEEYKLLLELLKGKNINEIKQVKNVKNIVENNLEKEEEFTCDDLDSLLFNKKEEKQEEDILEAPLTELERLYRSIR